MTKKILKIVLMVLFVHPIKWKNEYRKINEIINKLDN